MFYDVVFRWRIVLSTLTRATLTLGQRTASTAARASGASRRCASRPGAIGTRNHGQRITKQVLISIYSVLWKSVYAKNVKVLAYAPAHGLMTSDHSPLYAGLSLQLEYPPIPHARANCKIKFTQLKVCVVHPPNEETPSSLGILLPLPLPFLLLFNCAYSCRE